MKIMAKNKYSIWIKIVSILIPVVVAVLFTVRIPNVEPLSFLPPIYATINALTAVLLVVALKAIKSGKRLLHERLMKTCIALSLVFLVMYIAYHMTSDPTPFGGEGAIAYLYYLLHSTMHYIVAKLKKNVNAANYFLKNFIYKKYKVKAPSMYGITIRYTIPSFKLSAVF